MMKTLSEYQPIGRMGRPEEVAQPRALPLLRRSVVRHRPGLSHRRRGDRRMKLARFGAPGSERPGVITATTATRIDVSGFGARLRRGVLRRRRHPRAARVARQTSGGRRRACRPTPRLGAPLARPSKIVCIGLNFRDHAAESGMELPKEPVIFFKATTALVGPDDPLRDPARRHQGRLGGRARGRHRPRARSYVDEARALDHVAGYALHNDYSERAFQLERGGQWVEGQELPTRSRRSGRSSPRATRSPIRRRSACGSPSTARPAEGHDRQHGLRRARRSSATSASS